MFMKPETQALITFWIAITGAITGILGLLLGLFNAWMSVRKDSVRIKVVPGMKIYDGTAVFSIKVTNRSHFQVTIIDVGFTSLELPTWPKWKPIFYGPKMPERMEARNSFSVVTRVNIGENNAWERFRNASEAYIITACGKKVTGKNRVFLKQMSLARGK